MKKSIFTLMVLSIATGVTHAQFKLNTKSIGAAEKGVKAATFSDADAAKLAKESVDWMDKNNPVAADNDPYTVRLNKIFGKHKNEDGLTLNYKVYKVVDINAFACADGSIRVFSSLMDMMSDEELLAVIGHEIGHVKNHDTRDAIRDAYKRAAVADAAGSQSGVVSNLTDSQLGAMANAMLESKYSRKQESQADDYGYDFMKKHQYNVMAMASAFKKLQSLSSGAKQSNMEKMMSSHPDSGARAKAVEEKAKKDGLYK
ncbi:M48 family metallopeptidase [Taibaiella koreensis]|uniref:M48 family metallopeptidase n=1 Tax=Taibaiella koreensis TaxID=1268548 RepID=UPI000E5994E8|nr:M48 family metallopeptidase [Taibaiella koreensis]